MTTSPMPDADDDGWMEEATDRRHPTAADCLDALRAWDKLTARYPLSFPTPHVFSPIPHVFSPIPQLFPLIPRCM